MVTGRSSHSTKESPHTPGQPRVNVTVTWGKTHHTAKLMLRPSLYDLGTFPLAQYLGPNHQPLFPSQSYSEKSFLQLVPLCFFLTIQPSCLLLIIFVMLSISPNSFLLFFFIYLCWVIISGSNHVNKTVRQELLAPFRDFVRRVQSPFRPCLFLRICILCLSYMRPLARGLIWYVHFRPVVCVARCV